MINTFSQFVIQKYKKCIGCNTFFTTNNRSLSKEVQRYLELKEKEGMLLSHGFCQSCGEQYEKSILKEIAETKPEPEPRIN